MFTFVEFDCNMLILQTEKTKLFLPFFCVCVMVNYKRVETYCVDMAASCLKFKLTVKLSSLLRGLLTI